MVKDIHTASKLKSCKCLQPWIASVTLQLWTSFQTAGTLFLTYSLWCLGNFKDALKIKTEYLQKVIWEWHTVGIWLNTVIQQKSKYSYMYMNLNIKLLFCEIYIWFCRIKIDLKILWLFRYFKKNSDEFKPLYSINHNIWKFQLLD